MLPKAYLFDMDHTLIKNDCDVSWKEFLIEEKIAPSNAMKIADFFFQQYLQGCLDTSEFVKFQIAEFAGRTIEEMNALCAKHFELYVKKTIYSDALAEVKHAIATGMPVAMLTATNKTIATPVAKYFNIPEILACEIKTNGGIYENHLANAYSYGEGKVLYATEFANRNNISLSEIAYYGDSTSDIAIMK
ncbi:MAG: HAD family hydrolase, partial [Lentisphaeria bacterium]